MACCSQVLRRSYSTTGNANLVNRVEVLGTWDFKWPLGTEIRVAFQRPRADDVSDREFADACAEIKNLGQSWLAPLKNEPPANLAFRWVDYVFQPSDDVDPQNGSPFEEPDERTYAQRDYDVLISLDALPLSKRDPRTLNRTQRIFLPTSELGSFARRVDYGVPTMYVGPFTGFGDTLPDYYRNNAIARYYVMHEFGHVLGLSHMHQSPIFRQALAAKHPEVAQHLKNIVTIAAELQETRALLVRGERLAEREVALRSELRKHLADIKSKLKAFLLSHQVPLTLVESELDDFLVAQVVDTWPGNQTFSDWPENVNPSIMDIPYFECLVGIHSEPMPCARCEVILERGRPFDEDLMFLRKLYPQVMAPERSAEPQLVSPP